MLQTRNTGSAQQHQHKSNHLTNLSKGILTIFTALGLSSLLALNVSYAAPSNEAQVDSQKELKQVLPLEDKTLRVAFSVAPPFVIVSGRFSDLEGIDVDIVRELQKRTGFKTFNNRYEVMNFNEMMEIGEHGEIDIIGGGIYATESRHKFFDFAGPSYQTSASLVTHKDSDIKNINDLNGKIVAAENGTVAGDLIPPESGVNVRMYYTPTNFMALYNVSRKKADAVITDEPLAQIYIENWPDSDLVIQMQMPESSADMAIILKKDSEVTKVLQATYEEMLKDGTVADIVQKYIHKANISGLFGERELEISGSEEEEKKVAPLEEGKIDKSARYERIAKNQNNNAGLQVDDVFSEDADPFAEKKNEGSALTTSTSSESLEQEKEGTLEDKLEASLNLETDASNNAEGEQEHLSLDALIKEADKKEEKSDNQDLSLDQAKILGLDEEQNSTTSEVNPNTSSEVSDILEQHIEAPSSTQANDSEHVSLEALIENADNKENKQATSDLTSDQAKILGLDEEQDLGASSDTNALHSDINAILENNTEANTNNNANEASATTNDSVDLHTDINDILEGNGNTEQNNTLDSVALPEVDDNKATQALDSESDAHLQSLNELLEEHNENEANNDGNDSALDPSLEPQEEDKEYERSSILDF